MGTADYTVVRLGHEPEASYIIIMADEAKWRWMDTAKKCNAEIVNMVKDSIAEMRIADVRAKLEGFGDREDGRPLWHDQFQSLDEEEEPTAETGDPEQDDGPGDQGGR